MSEEEKKGRKGTTEILVEALADSNRQANSSSKNVVRVLGTLLAFSVLGNIALAGLNISGSFFGTDIKMGGVDPKAEPFDEAFMELGYEDPEVPPMEWCIDAMSSGEIHPDDLNLCIELYPELTE
jgi:hypothetical protein